jgi:hypothetical protein
VVGIDIKAELRLGVLRQAPKQLIWSLHRKAAVLTDEVAVSAGRQVVRGRAMPEMGVDDHAQFLQLVEIAIDRREVHVGGLGLDLVGNVLGCAVAGAVEEHPEEQAP